MEEDRGLPAAAAAPVHVLAAGAALVATRGAVLNLVDAPRVRVPLAPNHIPGPGQTRGGPTIDPVQGTYHDNFYKNGFVFYCSLCNTIFKQLIYIIATLSFYCRSPRSKSNSRSPAKDKSSERND